MAGSAGGATDTARSKEEKVSTGKSSEMVEMHKQDTDIPGGQHVIIPTPSLAYVFTLSSTSLFCSLQLSLLLDATQEQW